MAFPRRRHTQVATLSWQRDKYNVSDQLVGASVLDVDATLITGSSEVAFDVVVRGLTMAIAEANAGSGGFLAEVVAEVLDVEVSAVHIDIEDAAVEEDVVALETTARACDVVRGGVATFPPVDVKGYDSLADWLRVEVDDWEAAPANVKKEAKCRARMADLVVRCTEAVVAEDGLFLRRAGDPVGPDSRGPVDGEGVRPAVVGVKSTGTGAIRYRNGTSYYPEAASVVDCYSVLENAADNGASFRNLNGSPIGTLMRTEVDFVFVPENFPVTHNQSVIIRGSQEGRSLHGQYVARRRYLWTSCVGALLDSDDASIDDLAFRKQYAVYGLQDENRPQWKNVNDWIIKRPPGWQEPQRRRGVRRGGAA